jgi:hypothetical protein
MEAAIQAALIREAAVAGCHDLDVLKLADLKDVVLDHSGGVVGAKKAIAELKATKPLFFEKPFNAMTATPEELAKHSRKHGITLRKY